MRTPAGGFQMVEFWILGFQDSKLDSFRFEIHRMFANDVDQLDG